MRQVFLAGIAFLSIQGALEGGADSDAGSIIRELARVNAELRAMSCEYTYDEITIDHDAGTRRMTGCLVEMDEVSDGRFRSSVTTRRNGGESPDNRRETLHDGVSYWKVSSSPRGGAGPPPTVVSLPNLRSSYEVEASIRGYLGLSVLPAAPTSYRTLMPLHAQLELADRVERLPDARLDGTECRVLRWTYTLEDLAYRRTVWLDAARCFVLCKLVEERQFDKAAGFVETKRATVSEFGFTTFASSKSANERLWYPKALRVEHFRRDLAKPVGEHVYAVTRLNVNRPPPPADRFRPDLQEGTRVIDHETREVRVYDERPIRRLNNFLMRRALDASKAIDLVPPDPTLASAEPSHGLTYYASRTAAVLVVVGLVAAGILARGRRTYP